MPRKKQPEWISLAEAAELMSAFNERAIGVDYVRRLGNMGKVETKRLDGRTKLYARGDVEGYKVRKNTSRKIVDI